MLVINGVNGVTTAPTTGNLLYKDGIYATFMATVIGTGAVGATVVIEFSTDGTNWAATPAGTITLSGTTSSTDGFTTAASWKFARARVTAVSGTGATVTAQMGV
jgi:hypothetical protein